MPREIDSQLLDAVNAGNYLLAEYYLRAGANPDAVPALHLAAQLNHIAIAQLLLTYKASLEARTADYHTPLIFAAAWGHADMVKLLLGYGANSAATDKNGWTALQWAIARQQHSIIPLLYVEGNFYIYHNGHYFIAKDGSGKLKRPNNQSDGPVLEKLAGRIEGLAINDPNIELTPLQTEFIRTVKSIDEKAKKKNGEIKKGAIKLEKLKIDIAHNISISSIMESIANRLNNPVAAQDQWVDRFIDEVISSDEEAERESTKKSFIEIQSPQTSPEEKIKLADKITKRLNSATPNLMPGHRSTNRSVKEKRDPHVVISRENQQRKYKEHKRSQRIAVAARHFLATPEVPRYQPKTLTTPDGKRIAQSSSVNEEPEMSWLFYESPTEDLFSEDGYTSDSEMETVQRNMPGPLSPSSAQPASHQPVASLSELSLPVEQIPPQSAVADDSARGVARTLTFSPINDNAPSLAALSAASDGGPSNPQIKADAELAIAQSIEEVENKKSRDEKKKIAIREQQEAKEAVRVVVENDRIETAKKISLAEQQEQDNNEIYEREKEEKKRLRLGVRHDEQSIAQPAEVVFSQINSGPPPIEQPIQGDVQELAAQLDNLSIESPPPITPPTSPKADNKASAIKQILQTQLSEEQLDYIVLFAKSNDIDSAKMSKEEAQLLQALHLERGEHLLKLVRHPYYQNIGSLKQAEAHLFAAIKIIDNLKEEVPLQIFNLYKECQYRIQHLPVLRLRLFDPAATEESTIETVNPKQAPHNPRVKQQMPLASFSRLMGGSSQVQPPRQLGSKKDSKITENMSSRSYRKN